ncbi:MAG: hypothetical protein Q8K56_01175 [Rhodoglobus sp.]|nr:hypothetical protein [Rhodoglobus sp.]
MDWLIFAGIAVILAVVGVIANQRGWIDLTNKARRSGGGAGAMGIMDEVFAPTRHEAQIELDRQTVLPAPAPVPGDGDLSIGSGSSGRYGGQVRIDLDATSRG